MEMIDFSFLLYFLPVMLLVYFILSFSARVQNLWLVICSLIFYTLGNYAYVFLLAGLALANYGLGLVIGRLAKGGKAKKARRVIALACVVNLSPLLFFKYLPAVVPTVWGWLGWDVPAFALAPLGISILALRGISFAVDIYRGRVASAPHLLDAMLYLTFFPSLQAGPIVRYHDVAGQLSKRTFRVDHMVGGLCRLVVGLAKVVLLGRPAMAVADIVFSQSNISGIFTIVPAALALLGVFAYAVGLYHYLSGFSDLVIGLGAVLGFTLPENFSHPHLAASVGEFWSRCFSSLTTWFDDYVYQPLGKKRANNDWMVVHTLLMWVLIALWLGPGLPNLIFGVWSFSFILVERIIEIDPGNTRSPLRHFFVIIFIPIMLIALRTDTIYQFTLYLSGMLGMRGNGFHSELAVLLLKESWPVLLAGFIASFPIGTGLRRLAQRPRNFLGGVVNLLYPAVMLALLALVILSLSGTSYNPYLMLQQYLWG